MNAPLKTDSRQQNAALLQAIQAATDSIAPTWPLDRMIAVNPYWEQISEHFNQVAEKQAKLAGSAMTLPLSYYQKRWIDGTIKPVHLEQALAEFSSEQAAAKKPFEALTTEQAIAGLAQSDKAPVPPPLLGDTLDQMRDLQHEPAWCDTITFQVSQFCAAWFDEDQADWHPGQNEATGHGSLYKSWRKTLTRDHSVALLMKAPGIAAKAKTLSEDPVQQIADTLHNLQIPEELWPEYLQAVLMRISGWASWAAYLRWQARLEGKEDNTLTDLLAVRLSWQQLIDDGQRQQGSVWQRWQLQWQEHLKQHGSLNPLNRIWQRAHEISYQQQLSKRLQEKPQPLSARPSVQAVFCIDVRSEVFRRHLEAQSDEIQTLGFAGFFGMPVSYTPLGTEATRPQLPGLLAPALHITDSCGNAVKDHKIVHKRRSNLNKLMSWQPFKSVPASAFTLVETLGLSYAGKLIRRSLPAQNDLATGNRLGLDKGCDLQPSLASSGADLALQTELAKKVLTGMNLTQGLAPLVLLVGHGSQSHNNPQRAGLDCGACCGQTGEVNSRALAKLLNDTEVRTQLADQGMTIPATTHFVAALHNTTTEEISLFDQQQIPESHQLAVNKLLQQLAAAGKQARQERVPSLGLADLQDQPEKLTKTIKQRANDWAQTRPEWGLTNNASFIIAPRSRTRGIKLDGRSFLHEYSPQKDPEGALLEQIMTAPMVVTHWINMQYFASTVDNTRYGSGNKTLHNVVGGRLGVFEGNGGDLRTGLALQSVHNGEDWQHEPLRLTVVIDSDRVTIETILSKHDTLRQLADNRWLYLARFTPMGIEFYQGEGKWFVSC
ncbi:YbcC family protein [Oceanospirillum sanctuarii]|uniref:YbcC family protein n=1 Tax=Oceanospirillum sanctuarii TaxID=1434821 RepID=UPI000A368A41|nr:DUF2309 domain-containing protein [Oceanospirillum sanctuarii]